MSHATRENYKALEAILLSHAEQNPRKERKVRQLVDKCRRDLIPEEIERQLAMALVAGLNYGKWPWAGEK